ncbi:unnamed protein product [Merluccius merluccius]
MLTKTNGKKVAASVACVAALTLAVLLVAAQRHRVRGGAVDATAAAEDAAPQQGGNAAGRGLSRRPRPARRSPARPEGETRRRRRASRRTSPS